MPEIIGLILNYRDAERTLRCVRRLLDDGVGHVLVWDNSADDRASAKKLAEHLQEQEDVSLEISPLNLGFAAGVNRGAEWIRKRFPNTWILLINNDAIVLPGATSAMTIALLENPSAVIAYPTIKHGDRIVGTMFYQRHFALLTTRKLPGSFPYASGCCQLLATERLKENWFDEDFFMYGEDTELSWRLGIHGMVYVPGQWVYHEGSASSGIGSPFYEAHIVAAHWLLARKLARNHLEHSLFWLGRVLFLLLRAVLRAWRYRSLVPIRSFYQGWRLACQS